VKYGAALPAFRGKRTAVPFDDSARNAQSHAHALILGGKERLEYLLQPVWRYSRARITDQQKGANKNCVARVDRALTAKPGSDPQTRASHTRQSRNFRSSRRDPKTVFEDNGPEVNVLQDNSASYIRYRRVGLSSILNQVHGYFYLLRHRPFGSEKWSAPCSTRPRHSPIAIIDRRVLFQISRSRPRNEHRPPREVLPQTRHLNLSSFGASPRDSNRRGHSSGKVTRQRTFFTCSKAAFVCPE
jgi:hypothetical protein